MPTRRFRLHRDDNAIVEGDAKSGDQMVYVTCPDCGEEARVAVVHAGLGQSSDAPRYYCDGCDIESLTATEL